jgi:putative intracellular protease/amidase
LAALSGLKVAILVESQYIQAEIDIYRKRFAELGASVDLLAHLYGKTQLTLVSEVEEVGQKPTTLDVSLDVAEARVDDYAAVVMSANYTSVRLRHFESSQGRPLDPTQARTAPAVRFYARAMRDKQIIKGALCHGLWILTPAPDLLAGRRVICHDVVLSDVVNAGGIYTHSESGVVVDDDLVTGRSYHEAAAMVDAIADQIVRKRSAARSDTSQPISLPERRTGQKRRILVVLSEMGYWGEELVGPVEVFDAAGYEVDFVTPNGKRPVAITVSMDPEYIDPPLGRSVTSEQVAAKVRDFDDPSTANGQRLAKPLALASLLPERPYASAPAYVRALESYNDARDRAERQLLERYDAMVIVGGSGALADLANNERLHDLIRAFVRADRPVAAECYGVSCLAFARDWEDRKSIIWGKNVTGHCIEYDYKDGTGFMAERGRFYDFNMGPPPYPLEFILRDATGPEGGYHGNFGKATSVIVDYPFITGRSTPDSYLTGEKVVEVLEGSPPLRRFGW